MSFLQLKYRLVNSRLVNDSFWALLGNAIGKGLAFVSGIVVARFLGKDIFGEFSVLKNTLQSFAIFSTLGFGYTATKYIADFKKNNSNQLNQVLRYTTNTTLWFSSVFTLLIAVFAEWISRHILKAPHLTNGLLILAGWVIFYSVSTTQIGILAGFNAFKELAKISFYIGVITFLLTIIFTFFWGLYGALLAVLFSQAVNCFMNKSTIKKYSPSTPIIRDKKLVKDILYFTFPVAIQEISFVMSIWALSLLLVHYSNYGEVGLYSATLQWTSMILFIPGILRNVVLSHLSSSTEDRLRHNRIIKITALFNLLVTLLPALLVFLYSKHIEDIYGESFKGLSPILSIAVFSTIFNSMTNVYTQAYISLGRNWLMLWIRLFRDSALIGLAWYFLIANKGVNGALFLTISILIVHAFYFFVCFIIYSLILKKK
jgi:O-antigen/teichoic acid export membrane protein